jgi:hypothetical protein
MPSIRFFQCLPDRSAGYYYAARGLPMRLDRAAIRPVEGAGRGYVAAVASVGVCGVDPAATGAWEPDPTFDGAA